MYEWGIPFVLSCLAFVFSFVYKIDLYPVIEDSITLIGILLGFNVASYSIFLSNTVLSEKLKKVNTDICLRKDKNTISLYRLVIITFSYPIVVYSLLCIVYFVASFCNVRDFGIFSIIGNCIFLLFFFNAILVTLRMVANLYYANSAEK